jgi:hypothetical protein
VSTGTEKVSTYWFYAVALFGAAMTPYEVFFFSSGAVEEGWTVKDLAQSRANVIVGFPLGGVLSLAIAGCAAMVLLPQLIAVTALSQVMLPVAQAGGTLLLGLIILGVVAATFGAALETTLSAGLIVANGPEYLGEHVNRRMLNTVALVYMVIILVASIAAIPLLIITGAGQ